MLIGFILGFATERFASVANPWRLVWLISVAELPVDPLRLRPVEFCNAAKFWRPVGKPHS
ncbi:hypothetical protein L798_08326 [Zootermopsis nevadensis]|uniref:Uncharacterized protein n=1 Tax=Zootermopsis nevadensis TaxID=136037 RepID=A0A067RC64_ZOONE|nr:hypothetical protein L798_08326 [Zootermopsis nevadensis]